MGYKVHPLIGELGNKWVLMELSFTQVTTKLWAHFIYFILFFFQINYETYPKLYWSVYPHRSRESLSPVCGILKTCFHLSRWNARVSCQRYQSILERKHCHNLKPFFLHNLMYKQIHRANFFCVSVTIQ